jgi:MoaD family protein
LVRVRVRMMGVLRDASGRSQEELRLSDGVNVSSAIERLIEMYGEAFERVLIDPVVMSPVPGTLILLNGVEIGNIGGLETPVGDGDTIVLLPVTHGG